MRVPKRPPGGFPWEQPGYRFSIDWPPGFVSALGAVPDRSALQKSAAARRGREASAEQGVGWGVGAGGDAAVRVKTKAAA